MNDVSRKSLIVFAEISSHTTSGVLYKDMLLRGDIFHCSKKNFQLNQFEFIPTIHNSVEESILVPYLLRDVLVMPRHETLS